MDDVSREPPGRTPFIPVARRPEHEVGIRELRNAGRVVAALAESGAIGRVTSGGRLVGWLVPATPEERRAEELESQGKLRGGQAGGLRGRRPLPRRTDTPPLSRTLAELRGEDDR